MFSEEDQDEVELYDDFFVDFVHQEGDEFGDDLVDRGGFDSAI